MKTMHGSRNRLVRRLGMHANMTGLFHFGKTVQRESVRSIEPGMASAGNVAGLPLAKAFIPMPETVGEVGLAPPASPYASPELPLAGARPGPARVEAPAPVPSGSVFRAPDTIHIALPAGESDLDPSPKLPLAGSRPDPTRAEVPAPVPSASLFRAPETKRLESLAAEEKPQSTENDPVWNRLQNIFNKHRNKDRPQEGEASAPDTPVPTTGETKQPSASLKEEPPTGNVPGTPSAPTIQTKHETASPSAVQRASTSAPEINSEANVDQAEQRPASAEITSETVPSHTESIQATSESSPVNPSPTPTEADETAPTEPPAGMPKSETRELGQPEQPIKPLSQPMMEAPDTQTTSLQSLPLQAVWAVETVRGPHTPFPPVQRESEERISDAESIVWHGENALADQSSVQRTVSQDQVLRSALQDVQPAQATESGIEFIPPRRPRPVSPPAGSDAPVTENSATPANTSISEPALQRQVDPNLGKVGKETVEPGVVPTEIGPLPEDLWNLVGAQSPTQRIEKPQKHTVPTETSKLERPTNATNTSLPASPPGRVSQAAVVQRQAASAATATPASTPPAVGKDTVEGQAGEEVNIEELARQVYSELKHRLGLEWERLRRR